MIKVKLASELGAPVKKNISEIFVDGFGQHFTFFSKDKRKLAAALEHMFVLDVFYVAMIDGEIAGITACTNGKDSCIAQNKKELGKHLGFLKGTIANMIFQSEFQKPAIEVGERIASVEFVATASKFRGKGVATAIMEHLFSFSLYNEYILEVADTNTGAVNLYQKLGYKEFLRIPQKHSKISGINYLVYMKYRKSEV